MADGEKEEGLAMVETACDIAGGTKESVNNAGSLAAENGLYKEAAQFYSNALELDPTYMLAKRNLLKTLPELGLWESTESLALQILRQEPRDYQALNNLARAQVAQRRPGEAIETMRRIAQYYPNDANVFRNLGLVYLNERRDTQRAQAYFRRSLELNPDQPDIRSYVQDENLNNPNPPSGLPQLPGLPPGIPPRVPIPNLPQVPATPTS